MGRQRKALLMASNLNAPASQAPMQTSDAVIAWLMSSDPAVRWQVMRDLSEQPDDAVARERARVAHEGWGARLLELQAPDGHWGGGAFVPRSWASTLETLVMLRLLGAEPSSAPVQRAIELVADRCTWGAEFGDSAFFEGEVEPCINGRALLCGAYFGKPSDRLAERLLGEQLADGGWNCKAPPSQRSSFHSTLCVLEGLLEYERARGPSPAVARARARAHEYLLERSLFRRLSTGEIIHPSWLLLAFPTRWRYDILRGLDYLRRAGAEPEPRLAQAVALVDGKRDPSGRWLLEQRHEGAVHFEMEDAVGLPSRWNTLRALRVLRWYSGAPMSAS